MLTPIFDPLHVAAISCSGQIQSNVAVFGLINDGSLDGFPLIDTDFAVLYAPGGGLFPMLDWSTSLANSGRIIIGNGTMFVAPIGYSAFGVDPGVTMSAPLTMSGNPIGGVSSLSASGTITATTFVGVLSGNSGTASKWATARTITLSGAMTGTVSVDGSANATLSASPVTINAQTGTAYTLVLADAWGKVTLSNSSPITVTIPASSSTAFVVNTELDLFQIGAGQITYSPASGVTLKSYTNLTKSAGQYAGQALLNIGTDNWLLVGNLG